MLTKGLGRGGAERLLINTVARLDRARFRPEVAYLQPWADDLVGEAEAAGAPVHCLGAPSQLSVGWTRRLRRLVAERTIDVVHTHNPASAAAARLALPGRSPAFVHTEHNTWRAYRLPTRWANRLTWSRNTAAVAVSEHAAASVGPVSPRPEVVVHGLADSSVPPLPRPAALAQLGLGPSGPVIGAVGSLWPRKGHDVVIDALSRLGGAGSDARLVILGDGPGRSDLAAQVRRLGLGHRVLLAGPRDDVTGLLGAFDVFAMGSRVEGLPVALLEAMAAGRACVATAVGGIPEVLMHGRDGLLVPPDDPGAMAGALGGLLEDDGLRETIGQRAALRARAFDIAATVQRLEAIYERVLAAGAVPSARAGG